MQQIWNTLWLFTWPSQAANLHTCTVHMIMRAGQHQTLCHCTCYCMCVSVHVVHWALCMLHYALSIVHVCLWPITEVFNTLVLLIYLSLCLSHRHCLTHSKGSEMLYCSCCCHECCCIACISPLQDHSLDSGTASHCVVKENVLQPPIPTIQLSLIGLQASSLLHQRKAFLRSSTVPHRRSELWLRKRTWRRMTYQTSIISLLMGQWSSVLHYWLATRIHFNDTVLSLTVCIHVVIM